MSIEEVIKCDGCGRIIERASERYKLALKSDEFWNVVEKDYNLIQLDFCYICAVHIRETLDKIAKSLEQKKEKEKQ